MFAFKVGFIMRAVVYYGLLFVITWALVSTDVANSELGWFLSDFKLRDIFIFVAFFVGALTFLVERDIKRNIR